MIKQPHDLSPRIQHLRDYYFKGVKRPWNNEFACYSTGADWDLVYNEFSFYIVPETYAFFQPFRSSMLQAAEKVPVEDEPDFWRLSLVERRARFVRQIMTRHLPAEILPGDLLAGARFNLSASACLSKAEARSREKAVLGSWGRKGLRRQVIDFHLHGYGNAGATSGHLIPDHARLLRLGWKGVSADLEEKLEALSPAERRGEAGAQLKAMRCAAGMPRELAQRYAQVCREHTLREADEARRGELAQMAANLERIGWEPPETFWQAVQALWFNHMLVMADENYPGPGVSFGRLDQILQPFWERSLGQGMERDFGKEILRCFWVHCNTAYDAMIRLGGNQGITAGFGQLLALSGMGPDGVDLTNDLTYALLEVIDEMSPILEPKPNVRLHRGTPEKLLDKLVDMIASSQGAPFLLNFDERSMAGMLRQARLAGVEDRIRPDNVHDYAPVGCLENTMVGNDRSGTVDVNLNLLKAVELALTGGEDLVPAVDPITGKEAPVRRVGPATGPAASHADWPSFLAAFRKQLSWLVEQAVDLYEASEALRARFHPTPYLSCLIRGCAEKATDITRGGAELNFVTVEGVTFATTVDSLLAVKELVYEKKKCTADELIRALRDNWQGHELLQAWAKNRCPKYGRDDPAADAMAEDLMCMWTEEVWRHRTRCTGRQFRPGMLSWNYWVGDGYVLAASPDGRPKGQFLSNAICPSNGADTKGPTANANSVGRALGGKAADGEGDFEEFNNLLPNGASHTMTFNPSLLADGEHRDKFKAFLRGYCENGGTALQINMLDADTLIQAQKRPADFRHLLVRVTGYNAYFTSIGRELQDEIIAREIHRSM